MNNKFFDKSETDSLDKQIAEVQARPTLIKKMKDKRKAVRSKQELDFYADMQKYWYVYVFLIVSAIFTGTLGVYMGLAPRRADNLIIWNTDIPHIMMAAIYLVAFVTVTEAAFAIFKWLYFTREENNNAQKFASNIGMAVSGLSILGTGYAGGVVIASNIAFLSEYIDIPAGAQKWVVVAIPLLITIYTFLVTIYSLSSDSAASERLMREAKRESEMDHQIRIRSVEQIGMEQLQVAEIRRYQQLVLEGKITAAEAKAAIRAGRTLGQEERRQGRDLDGSGDIGNENPTPGQEVKK